MMAMQERHAWQLQSNKQERVQAYGKRGPDKLGNRADFKECTQDTGNTASMNWKKAWYFSISTNVHAGYRYHNSQKIQTYEENSKTEE